VSRTSGKERRIKRWEHEAIDAMQERLDRRPDAMRHNAARPSPPLRAFSPTLPSARRHADRSTSQDTRAIAPLAKGVAKLFVAD
jgi:hypothetical protein